MVGTTVDTASVLQRALRRQARHWLQAAIALQDRERLMHAFGRAGLHRAVAERLEQFLVHSGAEVVLAARRLLAMLEPALEGDRLAALQRQLLALREEYLAAEASVHFYTDAVNTRTGPRMAAILRACDVVCKRAMDEVLVPLGFEAPQVLTYVDKGIGASILRSDLRLWNGARSPFAAVKVTLHNLIRPTAIVHEAAHQVAHVIGFNQELASVFAATPDAPADVARAHASWASEIAADLFAFLHTGYGSVAALHDVVSGNPSAVFAWRQDDPHPIGYVRVHLAAAWCRQCHGYGPWNELQEAFRQQYDIRMMQGPAVGIAAACVEHAERMANRCLTTRFRSLGGKAPVEILDPARVSPRGLQDLERTAGAALRTSPVWLHREPVRTLAANSYRIAMDTDTEAAWRQQENWMTNLGNSVELT